MKHLLFSLLLFTLTQASAHPTGNMIVVGDQVLWSYVDPVDDPDHHACIMLWDEEKGTSIFFRSEHPASDFMLYAERETIYAIERRYLASEDQHHYRLLRFRIGATPDVVKDWSRDKHRIGESGYYINTNKEIIFASFPSIFRMTEAHTVVPAFEFPYPVRGLRKVGKSRLLLHGEIRCWLTDLDGKIISEWNDLINPQVRNAPLQRNQVFDLDYREDSLLIAYWGNRSFEMISAGDHRETLLQQEEPFVPHWVAWRGNDALLFSSELDFSQGLNPMPQLLLMTPDGKSTILWNVRPTKIED